MRILFLGPPGSGKGTQCKRLAEKFSLAHLASGDLLRAAAALGTPAGVAAKSYMDGGKLVPDPVLIEMFREKLSSAEVKSGFILDGFPRNLSQAKSLDHLLQELTLALDTVINLQIDDALLAERITGRRTCTNKNCAAVFHVKFAPPRVDGVCDVCGSPLSQRSDDKEELVAERLKTYHEQTAPLIEYYGGQNLLKTIEAAGEQEEIFARITSALGACRVAQS